MAENIYHFLRKHRPLALIAAAILWATFGFLASRITVQEDISKAFPQDSTLQQYQDFYKKSPLASKVIVAIGGDQNVDQHKYIELGQRFIESIDSSTHSLIDTIEYEVSSQTYRPVMNYLYENLPYFLSIENADSILQAQQPDEVSRNVQKLLTRLSTPEGYALRNYLLRDPAGMYAEVLQKLSGFQEGVNFKVYDQHLFTEDGQYILISITPGFPASESKHNGELISRLRKVANGINEADILLFGGPVIAAENAAQIKEDTTWAGTVAVILILMLLFWYYRKWSVPLVFFIPPLFGITMALAAVYLLKGEISLVTLGAGSIVLGIALDYCFHTFTHIKHAASVPAAVSEIAWPLILSCFTTVLAFFSLLFLQSEVLEDFGLLAAFSLLGTLLFVLTILPLLVDTLKVKPALDSKPNRLDKWLNLKPVKTWPLLAIIGGVTIFLAFYVDDVSFEDDLSKINYFPKELQKAEQAITNSSTSEKTIYVVTKAKTIQQAIDVNADVHQRLNSLIKSGAINSVVSINDLFPTTEQARKRAVNWNNRSAQKQAVVENYMQAGEEAGIKAEGFQEFYTILNTQFHDYQLPEDMLIKGTFSNFFIEEGNRVGLVNVVNTYPEYLDEIEKSLQGSGAVIVDRASMASGLIDVVRDNFNLLLIITTSLVFITLLLNYGRIELALLTFLPMVLSWFWILGICGLLDIKFNFVNVMVTTFIFGLGDDFCIFVTDGLLSRYKLGINKLKSYRSSIVLSTTTTVIGTGVLLFAKHPALSSIATLAVIGMLCISFISLTLQPVIFNYTVQKRQEKRLQPLTALILINSIISFGYFALGCILMTLLVPVFYVFPAPAKAKKRAYNYIISKFAWSVIYIMVNVKKTRINTSGETFDRPAIIVANHQSFIDILATIMLHPRNVILTKEWVWKSPLFGWVVRYAGYPTAVNELDENEDHIKECLENGYSVIIFPEGTRSGDGRIKRFHKGAFYLAEKYQVDIIPVLLHGFDYTIRKGGFVLLSGHLTIKVLPRITPDNEGFGRGYRERAKGVGRHMREQYQAVAEKREDVNYYRDAVLANYIYKGPVLEWYVRIKLKLEKNFALFDTYVPREGLVIDLGCGYGYLSYMLYLTSKNRTLLALDYDRQKIQVAQNGYAKDSRIQFETVSLTEYIPPAADCYILKDVLHYLNPVAQKRLLEACCTQLNPEGRILLRDGFSENKGHQKTRLTELFSTRLLGFNKTENDLSFIGKSEVMATAEAQGFECIMIDESVGTSNQTMLIQKKKETKNG